ncbi:MAG TPA: glycoside hydrolase domain-containing protein [Gaiellaceae bacterium]|nr:glycoside hydrolase domain-containing protein [Gaiellaceae bacterium]
MRWTTAALASGVSWRRRRRSLGGLALAAALCLGGAAAGSAAPAARTAVFTGYGFESCNAPSLAALTAWLASPYRAVGIYVGGVNRTCANAGLTPQWVAGALAGGWNLIPTYVGLQAPCSSNAKRARFTAANAQGQGAAAADDAIADLTALGLPAGSPVYYDMEAYALKDPACTQAVLAFVSAWVAELHARGYVAGVYGSAASTMRDVQALASTPASPDDIWIANWNGSESVFGDPYVSDALWTNHQRIHQYRGGHRESHGGVTINVDSDYVDGAVVGATGAPAPPPPPPPPAGGPSEAGSAASDDGQVTASWAAGTFAGPVQVTLTQVAPGPTLPGYGADGYGVQLSVADATTLAPVRTFAGTVALAFLPQPDPVVPVYSTNGSTWKRVPAIEAESLPPGVRAGYTRAEDGSFTVRTEVAGIFALVPDLTPPSPPREVSGRFVAGRLLLSWRAAADRNGPVRGYEITLTNRPVASLPAGARRGTVAGFRPKAPSVFRVVALDAAGNASRPSKPVVVLPRARPRDLPKALPRWAWDLFAWQRHGRSGPRPEAAPRVVPTWYWEWSAWRALPFRLRGA